MQVDGEESGNGFLAKGELPAVPRSVRIRGEFFGALWVGGGFGTLIMLPGVLVVMIYGGMGVATLLNPSGVYAERLGIALWVIPIIPVMAAMWGFYAFWWQPGRDKRLCRWGCEASGTVTGKQREEERGALTISVMFTDRRTGQEIRVDKVPVYVSDEWEKCEVSQQVTVLHDAKDPRICGVYELMGYEVETDKSVAGRANALQEMA